MRVAVGGYLTCTNSFATQTVDLERFQAATLSGERLLRTGRGWSAIAGLVDVAGAEGWALVPLQFILPGIGGKISPEAHDYAKDSFRSLLRQAGSVDGVFLQLHGAAAAEHVDDCEGDFLAAVREVLGATTPLIACLDGHANVTPLMVEQASVLIGVKTNPHYDFVAVGRAAGHVHSRVSSLALPGRMIRSA